MNFKLRHYRMLAAIIPVYARHRDWFYADGIHTKGAGSQAYAALIRETMRS